MFYIYIIIIILILVYSIKLKDIFLISSFVLQLLVILSNFIVVNYPVLNVEDAENLSRSLRFIPYLSVLSYILLFAYVFREYRRKKVKKT